MSKDLKDLINSVEKESKSQAELEQIIQSLKKELNRLEFTIKDQEIYIENLKSRMKDEDLEHTELPSEINLLKDIIISQRKDLEEKDNLIDKLNDKILQFNIEVESSEDFNSVEKLNEEFINAQRLIVQLTDENEQYRNQIEQLKQKIDQIQSTELNVEEVVDNERNIIENEELTNFKKLNFQLMQENGLLRVEVQSLKAKLQDKIEEASSEELYNAYERIEALNEIIEDYKSQIESLQDQAENLSKPATVSTEEALEVTKLREEFNNLKSKLHHYQQENKNLTETLSELKKRNKDLEKVRVFSTSNPQVMPKKIKTTLFSRMYRLLDENNKNKVIDFLIQDLKSKNSETKRTAIKILSEIKDNKVYNAFIGIIDDKDWIVRYNLIKALNQYENKSNEFKVLLKKLSRDVDVDVRELAVKILNNFSK
jgi:chromosome segregation ATPase